MGGRALSVEGSSPQEGLPPEFAARIDQLAELLDAPLVARLGLRPKPVFRVAAAADENACLAALDAIGITQREPVPGLPHTWAIEHEDREALTHCSLVESGAIHIQGASSQRCARALRAEPGERILDLAAAPGGKTLVLAESLAGTGELVAVEAVKNRFFRLRANLERAGHTSVRTVLSDGRHVPRAFHGTFDRVLLDAPCSSEARFDPQNPDTFARWSLKKVRDMARKQWGLLGTAIRCAAPGGIIVYATCAYSPEENEATLAAHVGSTDSLAEVIPVDLGPGVETRPGLTRWGRKRWPDEIEQAARVLPDTFHEGFFVARLRRRDD